MNINTDPSTHIPPYTIVVLDATDAYYYADFMGIPEKVATLSDLSVAKELADAYFVIKNYQWKSLKEMNDLDGGYDVRVYDTQHSCVYAAHRKYKDIWIGRSEKHSQKLNKLQELFIAALQEAKEQSGEK